jgi:hypothetical protein
MLFMTDRPGYMYYVKTSEGSPWMGAKFAIVNDLKGEVRPSDLPSAESADMKGFRSSSSHC